VNIYLFRKSYRSNIKII